MHDEEVWKGIPEYEGLYQASTLGKIRSVARTIISTSRNGVPYSKTVPPRVMVIAANGDGHLYLGLSKNGKCKYYLVHRLVLLAFVGPCPEGMEARHFPDRDPTNNRLDNISWGTKEQNTADKFIHGTTGKGRPVSDEAKAKLRLANLGKRASEEAKAKMRLARENISAETRAKQSASGKRRWARERALRAEK